MKAAEKNNSNNVSKLVKVLEEAEKLIGSPYLYGAYSQKPKGIETAFDCSSLVQYAFKRAGVKLPRSTVFQATKGEDVGGENFLPGDLVFFEGEVGHFRHDVFRNRKIYIGHIAIYLTDDLILHAKSGYLKDDKATGKIQKDGGVYIMKLSDLQKNKFYNIVLVKRNIELPDVGNFKLASLSQFLDIKDKKWQRLSCGVVSFSMLVNFLSKKKVAKPNEVLKRALEKGMYINKIGWTHKTFVDLAKMYGFSGRAYDLAEKTNSYAIGKLFENVKNGPVMVSIYKDLNPKNSGHLVVVTGVKNGKIQYYDPNSKTRKEVKREADIYQFMKGWKKRFIVIKKSSNK